MVIGSGFVRSGSGYVSTPATRRAARAAGTFGPEGYSGATQTAAQLNVIWKIQQREEAAAKAAAAKAAAATAAAATAAAATAASKPCPKGNEYKPIYPNMTCPIGYWEDIRSTGLWCVCDMWKSKVPTPPTTPPAPPAEAQTLTNALRLISVFGKAAALRMFPWIAAILTAAEAIKPTPTPTPTPTSTPTAECPSGLYYDAAFYKACEDGYTEYSVKGHNKCVCIAKLAEAKAEMGLLYPTEEGDGELGDLGKYTPYLLLAAVAGVALSLIKR